MEDTSRQRGGKQIDELYADDLAEQLVIGGLSIGDDGAIRELPNLRREDFFDPGRGEILEAVRLHVERGLPVEPPAIGGALADHGRADLIHELSVCWDQFTEIDAPHVAFYAARLRMLSATRVLQRELGAAWAAMRDPRLDIEDRLHQVAAAIPPALANAQEAMEKFQEGGHGPA